MANTDLEMLLTKLNGIQKELGGPNEIQLEARNQDEFTAVKLRVAEIINLVSKKQDKRDEDFNKNGRSIGVIKLGVEIQDDFTDLNLQLQQMKEALRRQRKHPKKYPPDQMDVKQQQYQKYTALVDQLRAREEGDTVDLDDKPITLAELRVNLTGNKKNQRVDVDRQLNDIEAEAMQRFKKVDAEQDDMLMQIGDGLDRLRGQAEAMGQQLDVQDDAIRNLEKEVDKAHEGIMSSNARLKKVLFHYRKPSKFCLDVFLILLLLGLIAVIIKVSTTK